MRIDGKTLWLLIPILVAVVATIGLFGFTTSAAESALQGATPDTPASANATSWIIALLALTVGVLLIAKMRRIDSETVRSSGGEIMRLRQSLRVSSTHRIHAIEFDSKILLIGESEHQLVVLQASDIPTIVGEVRETQRHSEFAIQGVDLKDTRRPRREASGTAPIPAAETTPERRAIAAANLANFKSLLQQAREHASL